MESMSRPVHKKTTSKGGYNDVFSAPAVVQSFKAPAAVEDYTEIFGCGSRGSSIPVLDLSALDATTENFRSSKLDYSNIFGGFEEDLAVPYEELLSQGYDKKRNHSEKDFLPHGADTCNLPGNSEEHPSEASDPSLDAMKQFNMSYHKASQGRKNQPNVTTHVAKLHAVPGFTYFVNEPPRKKKTESGIPIPPIKGEVSRTWSFSGNIPNEINRKAEINNKTEMLPPGKQTAEGVSGAKGGSRFVRSQSEDRSFSGSETYLKSQSFKTAPSLNHPLKPFGIRGHPKRSKSSNVYPKANPFEKSTGDSTDDSDEELDINSEAAACAAALKRVLEKAQESIRLAKEIRERGEKAGIQRFSNLSSERSSKAKDKKHGFDQEENSFKKQNVQDIWERGEKDGTQISNLSSELSSKAKDKKKLFNQETNSSKKQNVKESHDRLGIESHESNERNRRLSSRSTGVSTASECSQEYLTSAEAANRKSQLNNAEALVKSKQFPDLVDIRKNIPPTLTSDLVDMDKITTSRSMTKQESVASPSLEKIGSVVGNTRTAETLEQIENNVVIENSSEEDFGILNVENNVHVDEQSHMSEVIANASDSAPVKYECRTSVPLEITEKNARSDMKCILNEPSHYEIKIPECFNMSGEKKTESFKIVHQHMLNESPTPAKGEEPCEAFTQEQREMPFVYSQQAKENGLYSCNEGSMIQQVACDFMASDDAPEACSSGSPERTQKDSQEGEACGGSNELFSCNERSIVQQEACDFVVSDDAQEVCRSGSQERAHMDSQEGEACSTSNAIQEIIVDYSEMASEHNGEEAPAVPYEERKKKVVEDQDPSEKKLAHVPHEEQSTKDLKEDHLEGEDLKRSEETKNQEKEDWVAFGEESDWGEVEKRIKKECIIEDTETGCSEEIEVSESQNAVEIIQETEETTGVHVANDNLNNDEYTDLLQKAAHEKNVDPDPYVCLHDSEEAHITGVVEDHEASNSTTGTSEEFYNCESEGNSEEALKACELENTKLDGKSDFGENPFEDHVSSSETPRPFVAVKSDRNGTNADYNGSSREHKIHRENVLETTYFIQNAVNDNDTRFKLQDVSEDQKATNVAFTADSRGRVTDENVKEPEPPFLNPESGGDFCYRFRENAEHVNEEFSFKKEDEDVDPKVVPKVENKEEIDEPKSSAVTHQATITQEDGEVGITEQNIQFVRSKPQKSVLPEESEAKESSQKDLKEKEQSRKIQAMKERERDKDRIVVERAIREARERAFVEARERAERAAVARAGAEVRQRMISEAREKLEKASAGTKLPDKASIEAKQKAERAAVERATAEARERALEKALSQKSTSQGRVETLKHSFSSSDLERFDGNDSESSQRRKARLERHERIMERAAKALAEKNTRDLQAQKEQAERNRLAESLDADVKRWAKGKEGNLRALLSTLQYILGPDSGWQPISLTEVVTTAAVKKGYRKATLYVHPDKLQQRGASIQQKYICEKVFDLLKAAWNKFNYEER